MKAALITVNLDTGETITQVFDDWDNDPGGPIRVAQGLQLGIQADRPGWLWTIVADSEARKRWSEWQMAPKQESRTP